MNSGPRVVILLFLTLAGALLAGRTMTVGARDHVVYYYNPIAPESVVSNLPNPDYATPCRALPGTTSGNIATDGVRCWTDSGLNGFQLTGFEAVVSNDVNGLNLATHNCQLDLVTSDSTGTTPDVIASSLINVGLNLANNTTLCATEFINTRGDSCFRALDTTDPNTWIEPGGWWTVRLSQGGNGSCSDLTGVFTTIRGYYP
jgi:hypothetical protein